MSAPSTRKLHSLNTPRRVTVAGDSEGRPVSLVLGGRQVAVEAWHETWRIDDEWWRAKEISRVYWRVSLADGRVIDVYRDLVSGGWFRQAYG